MTGPAEALLRDAMYAYQAGWAHGANDRRRDVGKFDHDELLEKEYASGYADGKKARETAGDAADVRLRALFAALEAGAPGR